MSIRIPIAEGEWYHCFNRGVDKRKVFESQADYRRFLILLYVCNAKNIVHVSDLASWPFDKIFTDQDIIDRKGETLVEIGAYALMKNHFHLLIQEKEEGGLVSFMQKVMTGYTMYFNRKNNRTGGLFSGAFKSKHIHDDEYFQYVVSYIHFNPIEILEPEWKQGAGNVRKIEAFLKTYPYSSFNYHLSRSHLDNTSAVQIGKEAQSIISSSVFNVVRENFTVESKLSQAREYYAESRQSRLIYSE